MSANGVISASTNSLPLERQLRKQAELLPACKLYEGCEVLSRTEHPDHLEVGFRTATGETNKIRTRFLVGADGKRGVVRKHFLEPEGVKQQIGL
jgi:2-polyprenyl-6-methoxyphenol hydroxylase-like FAD-dependent oxidoreductase